MPIQSPSDLGFYQMDPYTVEVKWLRIPEADHYLIRIGDDLKDEVMKENVKVIGGLLPATFFEFHICSVSKDGEHGDWISHRYRTSYPKPSVPENSFRISPIPGYRQNMVVELPDTDGVVRKCSIRLWWQKSDSGWWASLDVPSETEVVNGRRLGLDCGILDNINGILNGNIVMRTLLNDPIEPDSECFKNKTHELRWEPFS